MDTNKVVENEYYVPADGAHIKRERQKARDLRKSQWWRQRLGLRICHYCQKKFAMDELTMDHIVPVARGGKTTKGNVVTCCKPCNSNKRHLTPVEIILNNE